MIIALNNKSNLEKKEFKSYKENLEKITTKHKLILCPTFLNIGQCNLKNISLGAQNVSLSENGAFTGEISATQLKSYKVEYCIVGHSERREYQKETNREIKKKIEKLFLNNITPILCVGETLKERNEGKTEEIIKEELLSAIERLTEKQKKQLIIAYEPIWAIGTGKIPTPQEIIDIFTYIKKISPESSVLYGGSVNEKNIDSLKKIDLIDGFLLGGLSLNIDKLVIFLQKCK